MVQFLLAVLGVLVLTIIFMWLKIKKAALVESALKAETKQRAANDEARIVAELERREQEALEDSIDVQEAINRFKSGLRDLN